MVVKKRQGCHYDKLNDADVKLIVDAETKRTVRIRDWISDGVYPAEGGTGMTKNGGMDMAGKREEHTG